MENMKKKLQLYLQNKQKNAFQEYIPVMVNNVIVLQVKKGGIVC